MTALERDDAAPADAYNNTVSAAGPIDVVVSGTTSGSFVIGGACNDGSTGPPPYTAYAGNTEVVGAWDTSTRVRCAIWNLATLSTGGDVTIGSTAPATPRWVIAGAEITAR